MIGKAIPSQVRFVLIKTNLFDTAIYHMLMFLLLKTTSNLGNFFLRGWAKVIFCCITISKFVAGKIPTKANFVLLQLLKSD
jgi:hypothetical protein